MGLSSGGLGLWILGKPIEKVILDNEEKSTTYNETGDTGLLLGIVKLPAPKNHHCCLVLAALSLDYKSDTPNNAIFEIVWLNHGTPYVTTELTCGSDVTYKFASEVATSNASGFAESQKGSTELELKIYLRGRASEPNVKVYCRNLVVTVVPLYES